MYTAADTEYLLLEHWMSYYGSLSRTAVFYVAAPEGAWLPDRWCTVPVS